MASEQVNSPTEQTSPVMTLTGERASDPGDKNVGPGFGENDTCCKCHIEREEEIKRLRLENESLKKRVAELEKMVQDRGSCQVCGGQSVKADIGSEGEGSGDQNCGIGTVEESADMSKRNNSDQVKSLLQGGTTSSKSPPEVPVGKLVNVDEPTCQPSTSKDPCEVSQSKAAGVQPGMEKSCPLSEPKRTPACHMQRARLTYDSSHTVLIDVNFFSQGGKFLPMSGRHRWDNVSVRMPFAEESVLIKSGFLQQGDEKRWDIIQKSLSRLTTASLVKSSDVESAIKKYNPKYKDAWSFDALHTFCERVQTSEKPMISKTLKEIAALALQLPDICRKAIPLLRHGQNHSITLSQIQIASLLANAFYCTFPHRNATHPRAEYANYPTINFHSLFGKWSDRKGEKLRAILHYFSEVTNEGTKPRGLVTFKRCYLHHNDFPQWKSEAKSLTKLEITSEGTIEKDGKGKLQVDFACNLVGGGVLGSGLVQEEILFLMNPELIVARLFTEKLGDTECLKVTGSQQYSNYMGYSDSFTWIGPHNDNTTRDEWQRRKRQIVAIDALHFKYPREQFNVKKVIRELNKAYCGFSGNYFPAVATGNWGCGAFGGDPKLKALIQMMAAAVAHKDVAYFTFGGHALAQDVRDMYHFLTTRNISVGRLFRSLENYCGALYSVQSPPDLYEFIKSTLKETTSRH
ncbi:poly(ADP-ribose) glycohydrolase [Megalops cyprinoides]|uniref:poly(ADP-ribose) glycohydrolase n=1 Tax=Megalops cyprinoides TaxID=118141 RepID=UPI001863A63D|nr:poly(ADP-ribose) glycohydrolase [Megalops cyprinoides]